MYKQKIGLWIPPRASMNVPIAVDTPAVVHAANRRLFNDYLQTLGVEIYDNLDIRKAIIKDNKVWLGDFCMSELDHFIWMGYIDRDLDSYPLEVLRVLEFNVKVYNSHAFYSVATDKFTSFSLLHQHGIPVSEIFLVNPKNAEELEPLFEEHSCLLKPRRAGFGLGIIKVDKFSQFLDILDYNPKKSYYLEKFYPNDMSDWVGVTVMNGKALYGYRKKSEKISGWKVFDRSKKGGKVDYVKLSPEIEEMSIKIGNILGGSFYGLDFIKTAEGYKVVDINCFPGIYHSFIEALNIPLEEIFFDMLNVPVLA